jgi:hypothetical protein
MEFFYHGTLTLNEEFEMAASNHSDRKSSVNNGHTRVKTPRIPLDMPGRYTTGNVLAVTGWSHSTLYNRINTLKFPAPKKDGGMNYWDTSILREALGL